MGAVAETAVGLLAAALRTEPARPLVTAYDHASGERTELSVATFANRVAKTANLLVDELAVQPGAAVALRLPLHWQAAVWLHAAWAVGATADVGGGADAEVAVVDHTVTDLPLAVEEVVSLGLGPMGLPRPGILPGYAGALDFDRSVHSHGDRFTGVPPEPGSPALRTSAGSYTHAELVAAARTVQPALAAGDRVLVGEALATPAAVLTAVVLPLVTGATAVLVRHLDPARLPGLREQENLVAGLGAADATLPPLTVPFPAVRLD